MVPRMESSTLTLCLGLLYLVIRCAVCKDISFNETLECHVSKYDYTVSKPYLTRDGQELPCYGRVRVDACYGRCDTSEIGDFKPPFKQSRHRVCTYGGKRRYRTIRLQYCHEAHPDPTYEVFDAEYCVCAVCNSADTSCESLDGRK